MVGLGKSRTTSPRNRAGRPLLSRQRGRFDRDGTEAQRLRILTSLALPLLLLVLVPGAFVMTGVSLLDLYGLGAANGVGLDWVVGAGMLIVTGSTIQQYNGPFWDVSGP